jgi:hypothetical protein
VLGEGELRVLIAVLTGAKEVRPGEALGWGDDRYRVYQTPAGSALVWYVVWDDKASGERFVTRYGSRLRATSRAGYKAALETVEVGGHPALRYVLAPEVWDGWRNIPQVATSR